MIYGLNFLGKKKKRTEDGQSKRKNKEKKTKYFNIFYLFDHLKPSFMNF
jgi:hypothetical protein